MPAAIPKMEPAFASKAGALVNAMYSGVRCDTPGGPIGADMAERLRDSCCSGEVKYWRKICSGFFLKRDSSPTRTQPMMAGRQNPSRVVIEIEFGILQHGSPRSVSVSDKQVMRDAAHTARHVPA